MFSSLLVLFLGTSLVLISTKSVDFTPCTDDEVYYGNTTLLWCLNKQTAELRVSLDLEKASLPYPLESSGKLLAVNGKLSYSGQTDSGMHIAAVTVDTTTSQVLVTGNGYSPPHLVEDWNDLEYNYNKGSLVASIDWGFRPRTKSVFEFDSPDSSTFTSLLNISMNYCIDCDVFGRSTLTALDVQNEIYWTIEENIGSGVTIAITVDIKNKEVMQEVSSSQEGFYGLFALEYNPLDQVIYGLLPLAGPQRVYNTTIVAFDPTRATSKVISVLQVPSNVDITPRDPRMPLLVAFNFNQMQCFAVYIDYSPKDDCSYLALNTFAIATGKLLYKALLPQKSCGTDPEWPWGLASMNTFK